MAGFGIQKKGISPLLGSKTTLGDVKELLKELPTTPYDGKDDFEKLTRQKKEKGGLIKIAKELKKSSKLHGKQSKIITKMVKKEKNND
jgi:hypothetical protein